MEIYDIPFLHPFITTDSTEKNHIDINLLFEINKTVVFMYDSIVHSQKQTTLVFFLPPCSRTLVIAYKL